MAMSEYEYRLGRKVTELRPVGRERNWRYAGVLLRSARSIPVPEGGLEGDGVRDPLEGPFQVGGKISVSSSHDDWKPPVVNLIARFP